MCVNAPATNLVRRQLTFNLPGHQWKEGILSLDRLVVMLVITGNPDEPSIEAEPSLLFCCGYDGSLGLTLQSTGGVVVVFC
jgi:hypothetical protein